MNALTIDTLLIHKLIDKWRELNKLRDREISLFNGIFDQAVHIQEITDSNDSRPQNIKHKVNLYRSKLFLTILYCFANLLVLLSRLSSFIALPWLRHRIGNQPLIVGCSVSRIPLQPNVPLDQIIFDLINSNLTESNEHLLSDLLDQFPPFYLSATTSLSFGISKRFPSKRTLEGVTLFSLLAYLSSVRCSLNQLNLVFKRANTPTEFIELICLIGAYGFIKDFHARYILLLTSNTRSIDFFLVASAFTDTECLEIMHGVPTKFIYQRMELLNPKRINTFRGIRMLPVDSKRCYFSGLSGNQFINLNMQLLGLIHNKDCSHKIENKLTKILFIGGTSHHIDFESSDFFEYELKIMRYLKELCAARFSDFELVYAPHPSNRACNFVDLYNIATISPYGFYHEVLSSHYCLSVLSSSLWEAKFLNKYTFLCSPGSNLLFDDIDLNMIDTVYSPFEPLKDQLTKFISAGSF